MADLPYLVLLALLGAVTFGGISLIAALTEIIRS